MNNKASPRTIAVAHPTAGLYTQSKTVPSSFNLLYRGVREQYYDSYSLSYPRTHSIPIPIGNQGNVYIKNYIYSVYCIVLHSINVSAKLKGNKWTRLFATKGRRRTRQLYCVECPHYSIRLEALGYLCNCVSGRVQR